MVASFDVSFDAGYSQVVVFDGVLALRALSICMVLFATGWISSPAGGFYGLAGLPALLPRLYRTFTGKDMAGDGG